MSTQPLASPYDHEFIRPGQPAADTCTVCGHSEAAHDPFRGIPNAHDESCQPLAPRDAIAPASPPAPAGT